MPSYNVAFRHAGVERVNSIEELFDCARLLVGQSPPKGNRLAIVTNAGGPGVMASDAWLALSGPLAKPTSETIASLNKTLPTCWSHGNPIDVLGDASVERYQSAIDITLKDPNVDAMLVILTPQTMTDPASIAHAVVAARCKSQKPIVASWIGGPAVHAGRVILRDGSVPVYEFPEEAVNALSHLVSTGRTRLIHSNEISTLPTLSDTSKSHVESWIATERRDRWRHALAETNGLLGEVRSKELLADYGVPIVSTSVAHTADEAVKLAEQAGYPVVLKILSPDISHKTDVGGVVLNIANEDGVRINYEAMMEVVRQNCPKARIEGVAVQNMISATRGIELLLGMTRDPQFGPVLLLGAGGITAELQKDSVLELPPFNDQVVDQMLHNLRLFPLLEGYRGRPGVDLVQLRSVIMRFARLILDLPELATAEINPLLATADRVIALDARMISIGTPMVPAS